MPAPVLLEERVLFSPNIPTAVNQLLQAAVVASHHDKPLAEQLFLQAWQLDGRCLATYLALYKFYFYQGQLAEAERIAVAGLEEAARQGQFPSDYRRLAQHCPDMYCSDVALFYLYTLKALAFIKLRRQQHIEARVILSRLRVLDPEDRSGGSVIMSLAKALEDEAA